MDDRPDAARNRLEDAIVHAFDNPGLKHMVRRRLGLVLEEEVDLHQGRKYIVADLVSLAVRQGWSDQLLRAALSENPQSIKLQDVATDMGLGAATSTAETVSTTTGKVERGALEKLVRERGGFLKWQDYTRRLNAIGRQLCQIEIPAGSAIGTGWLVAADLVLTNYHVVEDVHRNKVSATSVRCRFDFFTDPDPGESVGGVVCELAQDWLVDFSPYALSDLRADAPEPTTEELDYSLVRLQHPIGLQSIDHIGNRGWIQVSAMPPVVVGEDILLVPQHPDGRSLELAWGKALNFNSNGTRLHYDVNTESGSSGSPCMTFALDPFGLHHASGSGRTLRYNQCVPLRHVVQRLTRRGVSTFWQA